MHTPAKTASFENKVALFAKSALRGRRMDAAAAYRITIQARFAVPGSASKKRQAAMMNAGCMKKPDADNIAKAVCDALNGIVWKDDSQVVDVRVLKRWGESGGMTVFVEALS
jgi:Holliday junction resolvase RusA-like endonuclease